MYFVNFIDGQSNRFTFGKVFQGLHNPVHSFGHTAVSLDQKNSEIGIRSPAPCRFNHSAIKPALWTKNARGINKYNLCVSLYRNAADSRSGSLHLMGNNRYFCPNHAVEQS